VKLTAKPKLALISNDKTGLAEAYACMVDANVLMAVQMRRLQPYSFFADEDGCGMEECLHNVKLEDSKDALHQRWST
jgi:hypothetical protein